MRKKDIPSDAQAERLAHYLCNAPRERWTEAGGYNTPTLVAIMKRGWVEKTGEPTRAFGMRQDVVTYQTRITAAGEDALAAWLNARRFARIDAERDARRASLGKEIP